MIEYAQTHCNDGYFSDILLFAWVLVFCYKIWTPFSILILTRSVSELSD